ncbi:hypothetical protein CSUB8523_0913 [Campylobacter subantarcticus LMG 24377]|uniref:Uncharacterized protein n=2 Tax=Campylobacter subantarcticus TaxID=497724 RepID=A0A0A8HCN3_9BACT|nr:MULTISPECIES: hypothetical protein [Campylobacter]EAJ1260746.1 hypothetical protein [Campylobacter lari]AJC90669.1 hypothetical protein CSUB8521_0826 [Campylobacter subantarcticus LMG 24374]AJC92431.1 hypothetical protein CSUB8523_0913 [Campylobacter subantarcticus LMG 24377]EAL3938653.1 hypothetical protein [Campylobacter lari]MPB99510.1 hypothetical protein [Campylobacter subantarcticus]
MKNEEKALRVKYVRALEKFTNSAISALKREDFDMILFRERMQKNAKIFEKIQAVFLDSTYTKALEIFVNECLDDGLDQKTLVSKANALYKLKKNQSYKKDKHKTKFKDEY